MDGRQFAGEEVSMGQPGVGQFDMCSKDVHARSRSSETRGRKRAREQLNCWTQKSVRCPTINSERAAERCVGEDGGGYLYVERVLYVCVG